MRGRSSPFKIHGTEGYYILKTNKRYILLLPLTSDSATFEESRYPEGTINSF